MDDNVSHETRHLCLSCKLREAQPHSPCSGTCDGHGTGQLCGLPCSCPCYLPPPVNVSHETIEQGPGILVEAFKVGDLGFLAYDPESGDWYLCTMEVMVPVQIARENIVKLYEWLRERMS